MRGQASGSRELLSAGSLPPFRAGCAAASLGPVDAPEPAQGRDRQVSDNAMPRRPHWMRRLHEHQHGNHQADVGPTWTVVCNVSSMGSATVFSCRVHSRRAD